MLQARPAQLETRRRRAVSASALSYPVALLMAEIGDACDGPAHAMGDRIAHALRVAAAMPDLLTPELRAPRARLLRAPHHRSRSRRPFHAAVDRLGRRASSRPPHAHDTWCAYAVAENTLTETLYEFDAQSGKAVAAGTTEREPGYACFAPAGLEQIHRLGNATGVGAISLHAYGVEGSRVGTHVNRLMDVAERER